MARLTMMPTASAPIWVLRNSTPGAAARSSAAMGLELMAISARPAARSLIPPAEPPDASTVIFSPCLRSASAASAATGLTVVDPLTRNVPPLAPLRAGPDPPHAAARNSPSTAAANPCFRPTTSTSAHEAGLMGTLAGAHRPDRLGHRPAAHRVHHQLGGPADAGQEEQPGHERPAQVEVLQGPGEGDYPGGAVAVGIDVREAGERHRRLGGRADLQARRVPQPEPPPDALARLAA